MRSVVLRWRYILLIWCIAPFMLAGCRDSAVVSEEALAGKWDISKARRNGKETQYLRGGYFVFKPEGTLTVNITGAEEHGNFNLEGSSIRFDNEKTFDILFYRHDTLSIRYPVSEETLYQFYLTRAKDENH